MTSADRTGDAHEEEIRTLLARLGRPHASGGTVIERAAIVAAGADSEAIMAWILAHGGQPEVAATGSVRRGLHGSRLHSDGPASDRLPARFTLPAGALRSG